MSHDPVDATEKGLRLLAEGIELLRRGPFDYTLACLLEANRLLLTEYAPFKIGDRVRLRSTPVINRDTAPGWLSSKHFLIQGAVGTVRGSRVTGDSGIRYDIEFDDESWIDGERITRRVKSPHTYSFAEDFLEMAK